MANKVTKETRDRLDNKDPRVSVVPPDLKEFQGKRVLVVPKALRATRVTLDIQVFKVFRVLPDLKVHLVPKDLLAALGLKDSLVPRDLPVSQVKMDLLDPLDLAV
jgi:hypothetical protein